MVRVKISKKLLRWWESKRSEPNKDFNPAAIGMGWPLRANILQLHIGPRTRVAEILEASNHLPADMKPLTLANKITTADKPIKPDHFPALQALVEQSAKLPVFANRLTPLTWEAFSTTPFHGEDAPYDFCAWLVTGVLPPVDRLPGEGVLPTYIPSSERNEQINAIMAFVGASGRQMVQQVVCGASNTIALSALADEIIRRQLKWRRSQEDPDPLRICYIPGRRRGPDRSVVTLAWIVSELDAFFSGRKDPDQRADISTLNEFYDAVRRIREGMVAYPSILIIDGYRGTEIVDQATSLILDGGLFDLLTHLTDPRFTGKTHPRQVQRFHHNRIVVLTEVADARLKGFTPPVINHPALNGDNVEKAIKISYLTKKNEIARMVREYGSCGDAGLDLFETALKLSLPETIVAETLEGAGGAYGPDLAKVFMQQIAAARRFDALLICWIALSETGLRPQTLERLVRQLKNAEGHAGAWIFDRDIDLDYIRERLDHYQPMLVNAPDEFEPHSSAGHPAPIEPFKKVSVQTKLNKAATPAIFEFSTVAGRDWVLTYIRSDKRNRTIYALMYMLLAEEALSQMSGTIRRSETGSPLNVRRHRRIVEALSYGLRGLQMLREELAAPSRTCAVALPDRLDHILPTDPAEILRRLYALFHRNVLQAPPDHEMTRSLGRPDVVLDLWSMVWQPESERRGLLEFFDEEASRTPQSKKPALIRRNLLLELDILESLAKNAFQANRLEQADKMINRWSETIATSPNAQDDPALAYLKVEVAKLKIDLELARTHPAVRVSGANGYETALKLACNSSAALAGQVTKLIELAKARPAQPEDWSMKGPYITHAAAIEDFDRGIEDLFPEAAVKELQHAADLLSRLAEAKAIEAETLHNTPDAGYSQFFLAYRLHMLAGRLRRAAFNTDPLSRAFVVNAHSARNHIRVCLKLFATLKRKTEPPNLHGDARESLMAYFAHGAQKNLDILTRHTYRFLSERPSLLALEAMILRVCHEQPDMALNLLLSADDQSVTLARPRVFYRLAVERVKCLRAIGDRNEREAHSTAHYQAAAECLIPLKTLIKEKNGLWCYIRDIQIAKLAKVIQNKKDLKNQYDALTGKA